MDTLYAVFIESKKQEKEETQKTSQEKPSPLQKFLGFFQFARFLRETFRSKHQRVFALGARRGLVIGLIIALLLSGFSFVVFFLNAIVASTPFNPQWFN